MEVCVVPEGFTPEPDCQLNASRRNICIEARCLDNEEHR